MGVFLPELLWGLNETTYKTPRTVSVPQGHNNYYFPPQISLFLFFLILSNKTNPRHTILTLSLRFFFSVTTILASRDWTLLWGSVPQMTHFLWFTLRRSGIAKRIEWCDWGRENMKSGSRNSSVTWDLNPDCLASESVLLTGLLHLCTDTKGCLGTAT